MTRAELKISAVVPTYNRKSSLMRLLKSLNESKFLLKEVIIVDAGNQRLTEQELFIFDRLSIKYFFEIPSVCIQRNRGIGEASGDWIFLCDDDMEMPDNYLENIVKHIDTHDQVEAVSGLVLQKEYGKWTHHYPVTSTIDLLLRFIFQLSIWGEIQVKAKNCILNYIKKFYLKKGNHLSRAGWPVVTNFSGTYFETPYYGIGASVIKKNVLRDFPYDDVLDPRGIGDNFGVATSLGKEIHVMTGNVIYHHRSSAESSNELISYYRRTLALHYFLKTKARLKHVNILWFMWSVLGNFTISFFSGNFLKAGASIRLLALITAGRNPYILGKKMNKKIIQPQL
jgi:glycosyltransferase involved in cell wall biosynthesis